MFSFQNEAINFITNGKVTVRVLAQLELIPVGQCAFPNQFHENGWGCGFLCRTLHYCPTLAIALQRDLAGKKQNYIWSKKADRIRSLAFMRKVRQQKEKVMNIT